MAGETLEAPQLMPGDQEPVLCPHCGGRMPRADLAAHKNTQHAAAELERAEREHG
jgi:hypothetical protein